MQINAFLDPSFAWWTTFLILGAVLFVVAASSVMVGWAVRAGGEGGDRRMLIFIPGALTLWAAAAVTTSMTVELEFQWFLPFALGPILIATAASFAPAVAAILRRIPTHWMIAVQSYRVLGAIFLYPYMTQGVLTAGFAWPAGGGRRDHRFGCAVRRVGGDAGRPALALGVLRLDPVRHRRSHRRAVIGGAVRFFGAG